VEDQDILLENVLKLKNKEIIKIIIILIKKVTQNAIIVNNLDIWQENVLNNKKKDNKMLKNVMVVKKQAILQETVLKEIEKTKWNAVNVIKKDILPNNAKVIEIIKYY
jgi:hypothetical protein